METAQISDKDKYVQNFTQSDILKIFPQGLQQYKLKRRIAEEFLMGKTREQVIRDLFPKVGKFKPFVFQENIGQGRIAKPPLDQRRLFNYNVTQTLNRLKEEGFSYDEPVHVRLNFEDRGRRYQAWRSNFFEELAKELKLPPYDKDIEPEPPKDSPLFDEDKTDEDEPIEEAIPSPGSVKPVIKRPPTAAEELERLYSEMMRARAFTIYQEFSGEHLDFISTRALRDACAAVSRGIRVEEAMAAITKTWPKDTKETFKGFTKSWEPTDTDDIDFSQYESDLDGAHEALGYCVRLAKGRVPIFLVGPSGCGKSFLARDLADELELNYGECPMVEGATPSWLAGAFNMKGYIGRPFTDIYENGGVFCFEELDAADPNMLLLVNNAMANEWFANPVTGKEIARHEDFIPVATANTWGLGANRQYTGRGRLDAATLDRWRVGRVELDYDQAVERQLVNQFKKLVSKVKRVAR